MAETLVNITNIETGATTVFPYNETDTIGSLFSELLIGNFLQPSLGGHSATLQPLGRILDSRDELARLPIDISTILEISVRHVSAPPPRPSPAIPDLVWGGDREQHTPCVLVLDHSQSMEIDKRIHHLNAALQVFAEHISAYEDTRKRVKLLVVTCGGTAQKASEWMVASDFRAPTLVPQGDTPLGQAVSLALDEIDKLKAQYKLEDRLYTRPILIIMTDGQPTDAGWEATARRAATMMIGNHVQVWPVPIAPGNSGAEPEALRRFKTKDGPMMVINSPSDLGTFFQFLVEALEALINSQPGDENSVPLDKDNPRSSTISVMS